MFEKLRFNLKKELKMVNVQDIEQKVNITLEQAVIDWFELPMFEDESLDPEDREASGETQDSRANYSGIEDYLRTAVYFLVLGKAKDNAIHPGNNLEDTRKLVESEGFVHRSEDDRSHSKEYFVHSDDIIDEYAKSIGYMDELDYLSWQDYRKCVTNFAVNKFLMDRLTKNEK